jgi:hypothetical protein
MLEYHFTNDYLYIIQRLLLFISTLHRKINSVCQKFNVFVGKMVLSFMIFWVRFLFSFVFLVHSFFEHISHFIFSIEGNVVPFGTSCFIQMGDVMLIPRYLNFQSV